MIDKNNIKNQKAITLIALVVTIVLKCCRAALERMLRNQIVLKKV